MDEYDFYQGSHTGGEIDRDLDFVDGAYGAVVFMTPLPDAVFPVVDDGSADVYGIVSADIPISTVGWDATKKVPSLSAVQGAYANSIMSARKKCVKCKFSGVNSLPQTKNEIAALRIIDDTFEVIAWAFSNPDALTGDLGWETGTGRVTISGTINGTTDITLYLAIPDLGGFLS